VSEGQELTYKVDALPGRTYGARVARTASVLSPESRRMRVEADIERSTDCRPGMYATVTLTYDRIAGALVVPSRCLRPRGGETFVFVADGGVLAEVPVSVVRDDGARCVVNGPGMSKDSAVVVDAPPGLRAGQDVRVRWEEEGR
jgi:multidrug efflux pump subunit AcrA (membrane-fusion protein)